MNPTLNRYSYDSLSEAVDDLVKRGYATDLLVEETEDCLKVATIVEPLDPSDFQIDEFYRFEGMTDPADESIVYAISSDKHQIKGLVINSYGADYGFRSARLVALLNTTTRK
jgi:hypothetical protein